MRALLTLILLGTGLGATAQTWYEVEVIIFSQSHPGLYSPGATDESWPESLHPVWPEPLIRFGAAASPSPALRPLPTANRRLNNDAYALRVTAGYEVLWHQAWLQPMLDQTRSPWIVVESGTPLGEHYPLEGSLRVYLERFLHLDVDLWLSDIVEKGPVADQAEGAMPAAFTLPERGLVPPACVFYQSWPDQLPVAGPNLQPGSRVQDWWFPPFDCDPTLDTSAGHPLGAALDPYVRVSAPSISFRILGDSGVTDESTLQQVTPLFISNSLSNDQPVETASSPWEVRQIIPLRQSRRMRSGELHYLDHPRLGVLALITPVEAPVVSAE